MKRIIVSSKFVPPTVPPFLTKFKVGGTGRDFARTPIHLRRIGENKGTMHISALGFIFAIVLGLALGFVSARAHGYGTYDTYPADDGYPTYGSYYGEYGTDDSSPLAQAVKALLTYAGANNFFVSLEYLSDEQKTALDNALVTLKKKKFVVVNGQVVILADYSDRKNVITLGEVRVTSEGDKVYLEIHEGGQLTGKKELADLTGLNTSRVCSTQAEPFDYISCYIDNFARENPLVLIGQETALVNDVRSYLETNIVNFNSKYEFAAYDDTITATALDPYEAGFFFKMPLGTYSRETRINIFNVYKRFLINSSTDVFFVVDHQSMKSLSIQNIRRLIDVNEDLAMNLTAEEASGGLTRWQKFLNGFISFFEPKACYAQSLPSPGMVTCATANCEYPESGNIIPCNNQIDIFHGRANGSDFDDDDLALVKAAMQKLEKLGYVVNEFSAMTQEELVSKRLFDKIASSQAAIILTGFHGLQDGFSGPLECVEDTPEARQARKNAILNMGCGLISSDVRYMKDEIDICPDGYVGLFVNLDKLQSVKRAFQSASQCFGYAGIMDTYSAIARSSVAINAMILSGNDIDLAADYLLGLGPEPEEYTKYPVDSLLRNLGTHVDHYTSLSGPKFPSFWEHYPGISEELWDDGLCSKDFRTEEEWDVTYRIPCLLFEWDRRGVHLFPYVTYLGITELDYPGTPKNVQVVFSDKVSAPSVELDPEGFEGTFALPLIGADETEKNFVYEGISEVSIRNAAFFRGLTLEQRCGVFKAKITGANAAARANGIMMVGNPLAEQTAGNINHYGDDLVKNPSAHAESFWGFDPHFQDYNRRADGEPEDFQKFIVRMPYIQHPYVTSVSKGSVYYGRQHDITIGLSHPIQDIGSCDEKITVDTSQCAWGPEKFYDEDSIPKFSADGRTVTFKLRTDIVWATPAPATAWPSGVKITVKGGDSGVKSRPRDFPLMGNGQSPSFWDYDRDGLSTKGVEIDAWEKNSPFIPQAEGDFNIIIPCVPPKSACCIPQKATNADGVEYIKDKTCMETTSAACSADGGQFQSGQKCLLYNEYGRKTASGSVAGRCPLNCGGTSDIFVKTYSSTSGCPDSPGVQTSQTVSGSFKNNGGAIWENTVGFGTRRDMCGGIYAFVGSFETPHGTMEDDECVASEEGYGTYACSDCSAGGYGGYYGDYGDVSCTSSTAYGGYADSSSGAVTCNGGCLTKTYNSSCADGSRSRGSSTSSVVSRLCGDHRYPISFTDPDTDELNYACCATNQFFDDATRTCKPIDPFVGCPAE